MAAQTNDFQFNINPAVVLGALTITTLVCREIGFASSFMWWVTSIFAGGFLLLVWLAIFTVATINDKVARGELAVEKVHSLPSAFTRKSVLITLFILGCMFMMNLQILMIMYALSYVTNQMVIGGYANTVKAAKERTDAQNA